jgi:hypothetical protein
MRTEKIFCKAQGEKPRTLTYYVQYDFPIVNGPGQMRHPYFGITIGYLYMRNFFKKKTSFFRISKSIR